MENIENLHRKRLKILSNYFFGILLIVISILPSSSFKTNIDNFAKRKIAKTIDQSNIRDDINVLIPQVPEKNILYEKITVGAKSAVFIDRDSGEILFEKNMNSRLPMASTTKLMTALIVYENLKMDEIITVPKLTTRPLDSVMGIKEGQKFTTLDLLHGLLIESGSDAANTLVTTVSNNENSFAALMNEKASLFGLTNTQFTNSIGYDSSGHYTTAYDLAKLSKIFLENKLLSNIVSKSSYIATSESGEKFYLNNTNQLLNGSTYKGLKTGTTFSAGECLISYYEKDNQKIIGVVLNSPSRFYESDKIIKWAKNNFTWGGNN